MRPDATATESVVLPAQPSSVAAARRFLDERLAERGVERTLRQDAVLVMSELAANAVVHGSRPGDKIEVEYALAPAAVIVFVRDRARGHDAPVPLTPDAKRSSGRGLQIVDRLATWSEQIVNGRREVRAQLTRQPSQAPAARPTSRKV